MASSPIEEIIEHLEEDSVPLGEYTLSRQGTDGLRLTYPKTAIRANELEPGDSVEAFLHGETGAVVLVPGDFNATEEGH